MESKTLKTIQKISKIGLILSKICFIACIVGAAGCFIGLISMGLTGTLPFKIGNITFHSIVEDTSGRSIEAVYFAIVTGMIMCGGEIAIAKCSELYFKEELRVGTPFTLEGAKQLRNLGIIVIAVSLGCLCLCGITGGIIEQLGNQIDMDTNLDVNENVIIGITFIIVSLLCKLGAENSKE